MHLGDDRGQGDGDREQQPVLLGQAPARQQQGQVVEQRDVRVPDLGEGVRPQAVEERCGEPAGQDRAHQPAPPPGEPSAEADGDDVEERRGLEEVDRLAAEQAERRGEHGVEDRAGVRPAAGGVHADERRVEGPDPIDVVGDDRLVAHGDPASAVQREERDDHRDGGHRRDEDRHTPWPSGVWLVSHLRARPSLRGAARSRLRTPRQRPRSYPPANRPKLARETTGPIAAALLDRRRVADARSSVGSDRFRSDPGVRARATRPGGSGEACRSERGSGYWSRGPRSGHAGEPIPADGHGDLRDDRCRGLDHAVGAARRPRRRRHRAARHGRGGGGRRGRRLPPEVQGRGRLHVLGVR